jgi:uncharacterized protein YdgA (DUF945 family)
VYFGWSKIVARPDSLVRSVASLERGLGVPYLFEFRGHTSFMGGVSFDASLPAVDLTADGVHMAFSGGGIDGALVGQRLVSDSRVGDFVLTSPPGAVTIRNVRAATDIELGSSNVIPGDAKLSIEQLSIVDAERGNSPVLDAANVRIGSKVGLDPHTTLLNLHATYDGESLLLYGTRIADANVGISLDKVDVAALDTYSRLLERISVGADSAAEVGKALAHTLAAGPSFTIDPLRFRIDGEPFTAHLDLDSWLALLPALRSTVNVDVSKKLAREIAVLTAEMRYVDDTMPPEQRRLLADAQAGLMLVTLTSQGILVDTGDTYRAELRLADGAVTLNGGPLPFDLP